MSGKSIQALFVAFFVAVAIISSGCGGGEETGGQATANKPPRIARVIVSPTGGSPGATFTAEADVKDVKPGGYRVSYQWLLNGQPLEGETGTSLSTGDLQIGDKLVARAKATNTANGASSDWKDSVGITLKAKPLFILKGVSIEPDRVYVDTDLHAVVNTGGASEDEVGTIYYKWRADYKNAIPGGDQATLSAGDFKRGDIIDVMASTDPEFSPNYTVFSPKIIKVQNSNPRFTENPHFVVSGDLAYLSFAAEDPDGDDLSVKLQGGPPGMKTDSDGRVFLNYKNSKPGNYTVKVTVSDGFGGTVFYNANFSITREEQKPE